MTAKYVFAACLCASVLDLGLVNFVIGPAALRPEVAAGLVAEAPPRVEAPVVTATPTAADTGQAPKSRPTTRVVARFESDQPNADDADLRRLATAMIAEPNTEIVLEGHTDQRGDPARNRTLSMERAMWAQSRLVELGIRASRIAVVGLGAERPLDKGDDDAAVGSNRRVEVRWLSGSPSTEER